MYLIRQLRSERCSPLQILLLLIALLCSASNSASGRDSLEPETEYHTDCLSLFGGVYLDGPYAFHTKGFPKDNYFSRLNVLNGECSKVRDLPSAEFRATLFSDKYLFAKDGIYNRHSIYQKSNWQRFGSLRLRDGILSGTILADRLYLLQSAPDGGLYLNAFSLPAFQQESSVPIGGSGQARPQMFATSFVLYDGGNLASYDYNGTLLSEANLPTVLHGTIHDPQGQAVSVGCPSDIQKLDDRYVMLRTACGVFTVFDLQSFHRTLRRAAF